MEASNIWCAAVGTRRRYSELVLAANYSLKRRFIARANNENKRGEDPSLLGLETAVPVELVEFFRHVLSEEFGSLNEPG